MADLTMEEIKSNTHGHIFLRKGHTALIGLQWWTFDVSLVEFGVWFYFARLYFRIRSSKSIRGIKAWGGKDTRRWIFDVTRIR